MPDSRSGTWPFDRGANLKDGIRWVKISAKLACETAVECNEQMATVKGSKLHRMVVVPHRPWYRFGVFSLSLVVLATLSGLAYLYGLDEGLAAKRGVLAERDALLESLALNKKAFEHTRQELADEKLGGEVDLLSNEEVRQSVEALQSEIAELNEEIRFYKGLMVPGSEANGLRIEQFDISVSDVPGRFSFSLHLTQVVEKHEYVRGMVEVSVAGKLNGNLKSYQLKELNADHASQIKFRFRYFQKIEGEVEFPEGFVPEQLVVMVLPSDQNVESLEQAFEWRLRED